MCSFQCDKNLTKQQDFDILLHIGLETTGGFLLYAKYYSKYQTCLECDIFLGKKQEQFLE